MSTRVEDTEYQIGFSRSALKADFGVYVHIPFCTKKCDYCAFATWSGREDAIDKYVSALATEIVLGGETPASTIFVGGGTPSLLTPDQMTRILHAIPREDNAEVTIECNPETISVEKLSGYRAAGANRLSFGAQSFVPNVLESLGRWHNPEEIPQAVSFARTAGFDSINLDIIYGAFGESDQDWKTTLEKTVELEVEHISAYALTVEGGTPLFSDKSRHPDDDDQATKYDLAEDILSSAGYTNYEISNWAKPGYECRHNLLYWAQGNYRGFGSAAHSHENGRRYWNVSGIDRYIERIESGQSAVVDEEVLTESQQTFEANELSLRTKWGIDADAFEAGELEKIGELVDVHDKVVVLNQRGRLMANDIASRLKS